MTFNSKYKQLTESLMINKPELMLQAYCGLTPGQYEILQDGTINLFERTCLTKYFAKNGKLIFKFGTYNGDFFCKRLGLTTLEGCPEIVTGLYNEFNCCYNNLTSLDGCPKQVGPNGFF